MTAKELRKLIGKRVRFQSDKTRAHNPKWVATGTVGDVWGREVYIGGDWHASAYVDIIEILEE